MKKKGVGTTLSLVLLLSVLSGCQGSNGNGASGDTAKSTDSSASSKPEATKPSDPPVTIKYVLPGTEPSSWPEVKAAVNKKLLADGVNVQIDEQYIAWAEWDQKLNLMLSTGQDLDMFHVMSDVVSLSNYIARGAVKDKC